MDLASTDGTGHQRTRLSRVRVLPGIGAAEDLEEKSWGQVEPPHPFISAVHRALYTLYLPSQSALHLLAG
ncbi:hypothetical protein I79_005395 [Cricetulus griseus]|uniref:Uncharacterized protein n=1 Tax=Cricetulus griseus TaxID=10029 RepID=G3H526_CRIGR|nr:hypothetical protein I79_005395 [Cricetulus griseus]